MREKNVICWLQHNDMNKVSLYLLDVLGVYIYRKDFKEDKRVKTNIFFQMELSLGGGCALLFDFNTQAAPSLVATAVSCGGNDCD